MRSFTMAVLVASALGVGVGAQGPVTREPTLPKTTVGSELFRFYCSNCHGLDARGRPATSTMGTPSSNLTLLALKNGGIFPRDAVRGVIMHGGGKGNANGTSDMPVWGAIFRAFEPNDTLVEVRIDNLVRYIESLQTAAVETSDAR